MKYFKIILAAAITLAAAAGKGGAQISNEEYAARRASLAARIDSGVVIVFGSEEPEQDYIAFFQNPNFYYLTGFREPNATLVMTVSGGRNNPARRIDNILFVTAKSPEREVWSGRVAGPAGATAITGIPARVNTSLTVVVDSLLMAHTNLYVVGSMSNNTFISEISRKYPRANVRRAAQLVQMLRGQKTDAEIAVLRRATDITVEAQRAAMRSIKPGMYEYQVQATIEYTFRYNGAERPGFASIVGSGPNSTVLHYNANNRQMRAGEVVVMDIGALYDGYSSDVTRTVPVNGKFSAEQRSIYEIVRRAQEAAVRASYRGAPSTMMGDSAAAEVARGLAQLGLIEHPQATYDCGPNNESQCPQWRLFYMHGLGHAIGLEVHDPGTSAIQPGPLAINDIFTIEPGVYVRENVLEIIPSTRRNDQLKSKIRSAVERYKNIGVRIEDDYLLTANGLEWISKAPREIEEIEALMGAD